MAAEDGEGEPSTPPAVVAEGLRDGKPLSGTAVDLYRPVRVDEEWTPGRRMHVTVRRQVHRARDRAQASGPAVGVGGR